MKYYYKAFFGKINLSFWIIGLFIYWLFIDSPHFWIVWGGASILITVYLANNKRFRKTVDAKLLLKNQKKIIESYKDILKGLNIEERTRLAKLQKLLFNIRKHYSQLDTLSQNTASYITKNLDNILVAYIKLLYNYSKLRDFLGKNSKERLLEEKNQIEEEIKTEKNEKIKEIKQKRLELLEKRLEKYENIKENFSILENQMKVLEDMVKFLYEQSLTLKDPQDIVNYIDNIMTETETVENTIKNIETYKDIIELYNIEKEGVK